MKKIPLILKIIFSTIILFVPVITILYYMGKEMVRYKLLFPENKEKVIIPFHYDNNGYIITKMVFENDTLDFLVDTGASHSFINPHYSKQTVYQSKEVVTDALGIKKELPKITAKEVKWGDIIFKNNKFSVLDIHHPLVAGVIGGDILYNFCVEFDNERNVLILSRKQKNLNYNGIKTPFKLENNIVKINNFSFKKFHTEEKKDSTSISRFDLLFDTGYPGEFILNKSSYNSLKIPLKKNIIWKSPSISTAFAPEGIYAPDSTTVYTMSDFKLENKIFSNTIISESILPEDTNLMGTAFMRRFRSFTIDYPNQNIYFELPDNSTTSDPKLKNKLPFYVEISGKNKIDFSKDTIKDVPIAYLSELYLFLYHRSGFHFKSIGDNITIRAVELSKFKQGVNIGDTLIGVDNILFDEKFLGLITNNKQKITVEKDNRKKMNMIGSGTLLMELPKYYHFLKNGKLNTIRATRDTKYFSRPIAYSFGETPIHYFSMNIFASLNYSGYNVHILSKLLRKEKIEVIEYVNGIKTIKKI